MKRSINISIICLIVLSAVLMSGCGNSASGRNDTTGTDARPTVVTTSVKNAVTGTGAAPITVVTETVTVSEVPVPPEEPKAAKYEFNPHLYLSILAADIPQDHWDSFHNLCDALRVGETTFECSSQAAYNWATDPTVLTELFPAACTKIKSKGNDDSKPFENGVGRIYYQMPIDEYVERQTDFEARIVNVLNTYLEPDDNEFEKCLKLYDYMESSYDYDYEFVEEMPDGANYLTFMTGKGECIELGSVYAYLLLQAGVQAIQVGCSDSYIAHA